MFSDSGKIRYLTEKVEELQQALIKQGNDLLEIVKMNTDSINKHSSAIEHILSILKNR